MRLNFKRKIFYFIVYKLFHYPKYIELSGWVKILAWVLFPLHNFYLSKSKIKFNWGINGYVIYGVTYSDEFFKAISELKPNQKIIFEKANGFFQVEIKKS